MPETDYNLIQPRILNAIAVAAAIFITSCRKQEVGTLNPLPEEPGHTVVFDTVTKTVSSTVLESMRWQDVGPTAESCARHRLTEEALKASESVNLPQVIYLRGLLKLTLGSPTDALQEWAKLDLAIIPADHLYAPWRLASTSDGENRYQLPLAKAVAENKASPLIQARFHCTQGSWRQGLDAYLSSDPSAWSPFELKTFSAMKLQAPCTRDVEVLMAGALAGGKVPESLRGELARLIKGTPLPDKKLLEENIRANPALSKAAAVAAARALEIRQAFAASNFKRVLTMVHSSDPLQATDEVVLLAFLSAAQSKDQPITDVWASELRRRNPDERTKKWVTTIRNEAR